MHLVTVYAWLARVPDPVVYPKAILNVEAQPGFIDFDKILDILQLCESCHVSDLAGRPCREL